MSQGILAVDTEPASLNLIRVLAVGEGFRVSTFENYQEAMQASGTQHFDILFVGIATAESEGLAIVRRARDSNLNRESTMVILAATDDIAVLRKALSEGADLVLTKPVVANRLRPLLVAMKARDWKLKKGAARMPLFAEVKCTWDEHEFALRSMNISESGMLLQPSLDIEIGQEVGLEFTIAELRASLTLLARIVRKEDKRSVAVQFIGLAPEDQNAIQLYVMGRLKDEKPAREGADWRMRRLFEP
jgi:CheY-like chemotaxis protein